MSDFDTTVVDEARDAAPVKQVAKSRYPEWLKQFVHPQLAAFAVMYAVAAVYAAIYDFLVSIQVYYMYPVSGSAAFILLSFVFPFIYRAVTKRWSFTAYAVPATCALCFAIDMLGAFGLGVYSVAPEYRPDESTIRAFGGYVIQAIYPEYGGQQAELVTKYFAMPAILVTLAMLVLFVVIPSLYIAKYERGSREEARALSRVRIAHIVMFAVMFAAFWAAYALRGASMT